VFDKTGETSKPEEKEEVVVVEEVAAPLPILKEENDKNDFNTII